MRKTFYRQCWRGRGVIDLARRKKVFLMEAMWTRFVPLVVKVRGLLAAGAIGKVTHFIADLGTRVPFDPQGRVFNADLGGGALLQKGIYLLSLASMILGRPSTVRSLTIMGETGVDEHAGILLGYPGGQLASLTCSARVHTPREAAIVEPAVRLEFMSQLFALEALPYAAIQIRIGITNLWERRVTLRFGGHSFNIANKAVLSDNFVSGAQD
jgi:predicted dehydrogenase